MCHIFSSLKVPRAVHTVAAREPRCATMQTVENTIWVNTLHLCMLPTDLYECQQAERVAHQAQEVDHASKHANHPDERVVDLLVVVRHDARDAGSWCLTTRY